MQDRKELIKAIIDAIGPLIDAKNETLKTILMAEIKSVKAEIAKVEERLTKRIDTKIADHEERIETIEKELRLPKN